MGTLHLLKPNSTKGVLGCGKGEKFHCLEIDSGLGFDELKSDVENGALQFKDCLANADRPLSRVVVVKGKNEEEVLMAVNYLAGIANQQELNGDECDWDEGDEDYSFDEIVLWEDEPEEDEEGYQWTETPFKVPVIPYGQILSHDNNYAMRFHQDNLLFGGMANGRNQAPYWLSCRKEMICILANQRDCGFGNYEYQRMTEQFTRFKGNRHLFLAVVDEWMDSRFVYDAKGDTSEEISSDGLFDFVIENTADMILVNVKEEDLKKYRRLQFEDWVENLGLQLKADVPKNDIVDKLVKMKGRNISEMMENLLKYVKKESRKEDDQALDKEDFGIIKKFLLLREKFDGNSTEKLEKELIGMENVKRQVKSIVNVMKYCKAREKMGLGNSGFHNVHLLIGAPGTAKTTVAKLMGNMMCEAGVLPGNNFACVNGAELKGMFVGHSAPKTKQLFDENDIILIDEAYSLVDSDRESDSFSREAMAQMLLEIEEHGTDKLVMFAGYGGKNLSEKDNMMKKFLDANPGLKSRINSTIYFDSYTPAEMTEIVHRQAKIQKINIDAAADPVMKKYFEVRCKDSNFGNGREARSLLENAMVFAAERVMALPASRRSKKAMCLLTAEDVESAVKRMQEGNLMQSGKCGKCGFMTDIA